jgi:hypothetical protein
MTEFAGHSEHEALRDRIVHELGPSLHPTEVSNFGGFTVLETMNKEIVNTQMN